MSISIDEILMGRAKVEDLSQELQDNLKLLHEKMNVIRSKYDKRMTVTSGYRRPSDNEKTANAGKLSNHLKCAALDIQDRDGKLWDWCIANLDLLQELGLYLEDKRWTPTWTHFQIFPPKSGKRIYIPNGNPPIKADAWDGEYDGAKYDKSK